MKILNFHKVKKITNLHSAETTYPVSGQIRFEYIVLFLASLTFSAVPRSHRVLPKKQRVWWGSEWQRAVNFIDNCHLDAVARTSLGRF